MSFQQNAQAAAGSSTSLLEEFTVRIPKDNRRRFSMMKFGTGTAVDFSKLGDQTVKIERENNLKEYKTANDLDLLPKFGAGSEYGRDQKEESRRKKYGIMLKKYNPEDQPWHLKVGSGKQGKRYKGVREGTIAENTSYYIFTKAADGAFEAFPVDEWYNFSPIIKYKYLNSDEAEEEYSRRDKTLNYFSIMLKKRLKKEDDTADDDAEEKKKGGKKSKGASKDLILTDMDEWDYMKMSDDDDDDDEGGGDDDEGGQAKKKKKGKNTKTKAVKNSKKNSDDEAVEESDEGDFDDREVDYMSDSGSSSSLSGPENEDDKGKKYEEKGVDEEAGLRNILDSEAEEEEEEEEEKEDMEDEIEEKDEKKEEKKKGDDDSSSSSSDDDSDIEKASAIFLQKEKKDRKEKKDKMEAATSESSQKEDSGSLASDRNKDKALKRKAEKTPDGKSLSVKKHKTDGSEGITEDAIIRYLMRKPMTTKDLVQKFKSKKLNMSNEKITHTIVQLLKKINPDKTMINKKLYLSLKKPE